MFLKKLKPYLILVTFVFLFLSYSEIAHAATITWDGGGADNNWSTAENWSGDTIPGNSDTALFNGTSTKNSTIDAGFTGEIAGLDVDSGYSGTITQQTDLTVGLSDFHLNSGTYTVASGNLTINGDFTTTFNASFNHANTLIMNRFGALSMDVTHTLVNLTISNNNGTATNLSGGTVVVTGTLDLVDGQINNGDIDASGGDIIVESTFDGGTGQIYTGGSNAISITLHGEATLPGYEIDNANATAVTTGSGTLTFGQDFRMSNGSFTNSGNIDILFSTSSTVTQLGGSIDLGDSDAATVTFKDDFTLEGGTFDGGAVSIIFFGPNDDLIIEGGTFTSTSGTMSIVEDFKHTVGGTFNHNNGTVLFDGNAHSNLDCNSGIATSCLFYDVEVNKDSKIYVFAPNSGDTATIENDFTFINGKVNVGRVLAKGNVTIEDMNEGSGTLEIGGSASTSVVVTAGAILSPFHMNNSNANITTTGSGTLRFGGTVTVEAGTFTNTGNIDITFDGGSTINQSGGTFDFGDNTNTNVILEDTLNLSGGTFDLGSTNARTDAANDDINITGGTFISTSQNLSLADDFLHTTAGTFDHNNGFIVFESGSGSSLTCDSAVATSCQFYDFEINKNDNLVVNINSDPATVLNEAYITNGKFNTGTLELQGATLIADTFDGGTATLEFNGSNITTGTISAGAILSKINLNNSNVTVDTDGDGTITFDNDVTITDGSFVNSGNVDLSFSSSTSYTQVGGSFDLGDSAATTVTFRDPFAISGGTFDGGSTDINFTTANADITITGGTFIASSNNLTSTSDWIHTTNGTFDHNNGTIIFDLISSVAITCDDTVASSCVFHNFTTTGSFGLDTNIDSDDPMTVEGTLYSDDGRLRLGTINVKGNVNFDPGYDDGNASLNFTGSNEQTFDLTGVTGSANGDITIDKSGGSVTLTSDFVLDAVQTKSFTIIEGRFKTNGFSFSVTDSSSTFSVEDGGIFEVNGDEIFTFDEALDFQAGSTVVYSGAVINDIQAWDYHHLEINNASGEFFLPGATSLAGDLTITSGSLATNGNDLTINGTFSNEDIFKMIGTETLIFDMDVDSGTVVYEGNGDGSTDIYSILDNGETDYYNLTINDPGPTKDTFQLSDSLSVANTLLISDGTLDQNSNSITLESFEQDGGVFSGDTQNITINSTFNLSGGSFTSTGDALIVGGDFTHSAGTFSHNNGEVVLDGDNQALSGATTFFDLTKQTVSANSLTFPQDSLTTIEGLATFEGADGNLLSLISSIAGQQASVDFSGTKDFSYIDIQDINNTNETSATCLTGCVDSGNNSNWVFELLLTLSLLDSPFDEDGGTATVTATLSDTSNQATTVNLGFTGTATNIDDYTSSATSIVISAGDTTGSIILTGVNDTLDENTESVIVDVTSVNGATEDGDQQVAASISDDDLPPTVSLNVTNSPFSENAGTATVTASLATESAKDVTVNLAFSGTATNTDDYTRSATSITILAGNTTGSIILTGVDDALDEVDETVIVDIDSVTNGTENGSQQVTATISDDDNAPNVSLSLTDSPLAENAGVATVTATLNAESAQDVTVNLAFSGTATNTDDYTRSATSITISAGDTTGTITLTGVDDALDEVDETVIVDIDSVTNGTENGSQQVTATITDDDDAPSVSLSLTDSPLAENAGVATITATLAAESGKDVTVNLAFSGTATNTDDYTRSATSITISAGDTTGTITLTGVDDALDENDETVIVDIDSVTNGTENGSQKVTATITDDDDAPTVSLSLTDSPLAENAGAATVTATLAAESGKDVTVNLAFSGTATNTDDYTRSATSITISAGDTTGTITLTGVDDALDEVDETVIVDIDSVTNGTENGSQQVTATITDDDDAPNASLSLTDSPLAENGGVATVTATIDAESAKDVTVNLAFTGTATNSDDYTRSATSITISAGNTTGTITLTGVDDALDEVNETIIVDIDSVTNGTESGTQQVTATITDDDNGTSVSLSVADSPLAENGGVATVTATLAAESGQDVTVNLAFSGTATNTDDYTRSATSITISAGDTTGTITLTGVDDALDENDETIIVDIDSVTNGSENGTQQITATITDDDNEPTVALSLNDSPLAENAGTATVVATLSAVSGKDVTVNYSFSGTATNTDDYTRSATSVTISAGDTTGSITLTGVDDALDEDDETIIVDIDSVTNGKESGTQQQTATITDDDDAPSIDFTQAAQSSDEDEESLTITVSLSEVSGKDIQVDFTVHGDSTATEDSDYTIAESPLTISAGSESATIEITLVADDIAEEDETIILDLSNPSNADLGETTRHTVTLTDNETAGVTITESGDQTQITEAGLTDTYTIVLDSEPASDVNVTITTDDESEVDVDEITFTSENWDIVQTITVTAIDDNIEEGTHESTITNTLSSEDPDYNEISEDVTATITDNDSAGISVSEIDGAVNEGGSTNYSFVLTSEPTDDVEITITSDAQSSTSTDTVIFTSEDWNIAQTVTITIVDDEEAESNHTTTLSHSVESLDEDYNAFEIQDITVQITDNESVGVSLVNEDEGTDVTTSGITNTLSLVLTSEPNANVVITLTSGEDITFDTNLFIFTPENWDVEQDVVVSLDEEADASNESATVSASASSDDESYDGINITPLTLSLADDLEEEEEEEENNEEEEENQEETDDEEDTETETEGTLISSSAKCKDVSALSGRSFNLGSNCVGLKQNTDKTRDVVYTWTQVSGKTVGLCQEMRLLCKINVPQSNEDALEFKLVITEDNTELFNSTFTLSPFKNVLRLGEENSDSGITFNREEDQRVIGSKKGSPIKISNQTNEDNYYEIDLGNNVILHSDYFINSDQVLSLPHGILIGAPLQFNARGLLVLIDNDVSDKDYYLDDPDLALQDGILAISEGQQVSREFGYPLISPPENSDTILTFALGNSSDGYFGIAMILDSSTLETLAIIRGSATDRLTSKNAYNRFKSKSKVSQVVLGISNPIDSSVNASFTGTSIGFDNSIQIVQDNFGEVFDLSEDEVAEEINFDDITHLLSADIDGDDTADLIAIAGDSCDIAIYSGSSKSQSSILSSENNLTCAQGQTITSANLGDVNNDNISDLVLGFSNTNEIYILLGGEELISNAVVLEDQAIIISGDEGTGDWIVLGEDNTIYTSDGSGGSLSFTITGEAGGTIATTNANGSGGCQLSRDKNSDSRLIIFMMLVSFIGMGYFRKRKTS